MVMLPPPPTKPITLPQQRGFSGGGKKVEEKKRKIGKGTLLKNNEAVGNDGIPSEVYKFASERLLTMMSIFLSGCMLTGKLPNSLMHVVIIPLLKCKSKDSADVNNYRPIAIATALSKVLEQILLSRLARYLWTADSQFGFKQAHGTEMAILH